MHRRDRVLARVAAAGIAAVLAVALPQVVDVAPTATARTVVVPDPPAPPTPAAPAPALPAVQAPVAVEVAPEPAAPSFAPVTATRAAVAVEVVDAAQEAAARALAASLEGVLAVAGVTVVATDLGGVPAEVAAVDPEEFRAFTPEATANSEPLWQRISAGDVAVTHEFGTTHEVVLGSSVAGGSSVDGQGVPLRVGAFATNGTPPVADAIVRAGTPIGEGSRRLLVALADEASPTATAEAFADAGFAAEEIPDPRAPRDDIVIPQGGITPENVWDHLAVCESSGNWQINTGNGYYGGVQFLPESWALVGGTGLPHEWPREEQIYRASLLWQIQGWEAWPQCARKLGLIVDPPAASASPSE